MSTNQNPQVIILNGGSSSGKSSIARALQEILPGIWLTFGVDTFIDALPAGGDSPRAGITFEQDGTITFSAEHRALERSWYTGLSGMARTGAHLILDEGSTSGTPRSRIRHSHDIGGSGRAPANGVIERYCLRGDLQRRSRRHLPGGWIHSTP